jgi:PAS domain S-box-containing protein
VKDNSGKVAALHGLMMDAHTVISPEQTASQEKKQIRRFADAMPAMYGILGNNGNYDWHLVRALPFRDEHGSIISWYGIHTDINALKKIESELQKREHQLQGIIETVPSMFWSASATGEPVHINRRVLEYSGRIACGVSGSRLEKFLHPEDFEEIAKALFRSVQTGESLSVIHRLRRADGEYRWHHTRAEPLRDPEGQIIQWYGLSVDIDERKRAEGPASSHTCET